MAVFTPDLDEKVINRLDKVVNAIDGLRNFFIDGYNPFDPETAMTTEQKEVALAIGRDTAVAAALLENLALRIKMYR